MLPKVHHVDQLPAYHDDLIIVKVRPTAAPLAAAATEGAMTPMAAAPGLSALAYFERAGMVRRVVPLSRRATAVLARTPTPAVAALALAATSTEGRPGANVGVSLVELQPGTNLQQLQASLAGDPHVAFVSRVPIRYLMAPKPFARRGHKLGKSRSPKVAIAPAATPPPADTLWNLQKIRWREARNAGLDPAKNIRVAVLDTGIDLAHPDLPGDAITYVHEYPDSQVATSDQDIIGHGTHVSGTIRALIDNQIGINGICECRLSVYKIFGDDPADNPVFSPFAYFPYYVDPILYRAALAACLDAGVQVVNLSIGGAGVPDPQEQALFQALIDAGVSVVAAMGNEASSQPSYPAAISGVIAVGATALDDSRADFSNIGSHIALCAPGTSIWSTLPTYAGQSGFYAVQGPGGNWVRGEPMARETDYDSWQGTSMATPHVTAAAAMALAKYHGLSAGAMKDRLQQSVDKVPGMHGQDFTKEYGTGRLNLLQL
jgi:subtilisin family serine protease